MAFKLPKGFLMGVSSAATQIEGGEVDSNWNDWYRQGKIKDNTNPAADNDHWEKWEQDTQLLHDMGMQIYRFGIEWARICPTENEINEEALRQYRSEIEALHRKGIRPLMTIHHFTNPMWFEKKGGFAKRKNLHYFTEFVVLVIEAFGDLVSDYITINEPNVYATNSFCFGIWPPAHKSYAETVRVMENLAYCHIRAYNIIHLMRKTMGYDDTMVGTANHMRVFAPKDENNKRHRFYSKVSENMFQGILCKAMNLGKFSAPLTNFKHLPRGEYADFHGLNYYSRSTVSSLGDGVRENCPKNDLGWEIYPEGIEQCAAKLYELLPRPIWITENGTCDNDDRFRPRYIYEHLKAAANSKLPIERYYHWCFVDNFEWIEGNSAKFGLVTREREIKNSGKFYSEIIKNGGVDENLYKKYVAGVEYDVR